MASKRRKAALAAAPPEEELRLKSPAKRSSRRKAADGGSPPGKGEAICSYKTPKRPSRPCLPTFSSPANETDLQQEIFWDPQSPIAYKLDKKKQTAGRPMVEISEIVNRIAPQEEKPSCCEGSLLGMWIGDNAIPCTPEIAKARSRTKLNSTRGLRLKNKEEELMKLAKQFDKNLTEAIHQQDAPHPSASHLPSEAKLSVACRGDAQVEDPQHLPGEPPQADATSLLGAVKENAEKAERCEGSGQKPVDLDAEVVLNALFDCTPTKCSGKLSQGSSNGGSHNSQNALLAEEHVPEEAAGGACGSVAEGMPQTHGSAPASDHRGLPTAEKARTVFEQIIQSAVFSKTEPQSVVLSKTKLAASSSIVSDDFEDWDADLLSDDSFVMQITQNPELIRTPQNAFPGAVQESCKTKERRINSGRLNGGHCTFPKSLNDVTMSFPVPKPGCELGSMMPFPSQSHSPLKNCSVSRRGQNRIPGDNSITGKFERKSVKEGFTQLKSANIPGGKTASVSGHPNLLKSLTGKSSLYHKPSSVFPNSNLDGQQERASQTSSHHLQAEIPKKHAPSFDDWNEPRISDNVLDLFCKSESLWGAGCEDDDLLYQVCDDVERNTLSQDVAKENVKATLLVVGTARLETDPGLPVPKQGLANCPQPQKNRKTFSLNAPLATAVPPKGENSAEPCRQLSCLPFKAESSQGKLYGSNFVLDGSLASKSGSVLMSNACLNTNSVQCQNVTWNDRKVQNVCRRNQASQEKSKYAFRKASSSQARASDRSSVTGESFGGAPLALGESKNGPNIPLGPALRTNPKTAFRRHLSDSFADMGTEQKSQKCSQEEIARKKQEALERRKCKMQALLKNTAPT